MAVQEYTFVPQTGIARITSDLNARKGAPATFDAEVSRVLPAGSIQSYLGYVLDGEAIADNAKWFFTPEGEFFWSGNVDTHEVASGGRILVKPLDSLVCTQRFGERPEVYRELGYVKGHSGMDFRTRDPNNQTDWKRSVYAALAGQVLEVTDSPWNGRFVRITHDNGYESIYLHLSAIDVTAGQKVSTGTKIGVSGNSGAASEAPHLHFGYRPQKFNKDNGYMGYVDPAPYFRDEIKYV